MTRNGATKAIVVGAGIGGLTAAVALRRAGIEVEVYERTGELRAQGTGLSIMSNAISALRAHGIDLGLERCGQTIESFHLLTTDGRPIRTVPLKEIGDRLGEPSVCVHRADLQRALLDAVGDCPIRLGAAVTGFEVGTDGVRVSRADGSNAHGDVLIGADGYHSVIRRQLVGPEPARQAGYLCWLATIPFEHPRMTTGYVGHYWGRGQRFGLIDIGHGRAYWWGTKNMPAATAHAWGGGKAEIIRAYAGWAEEVQAAIHGTPEQSIVSVPAQDRPFLERWGRDAVTLLGDAAHPMLTSLGQGAGMAIEDAIVLAGKLAGATDLRRALLDYEAQRRARTRRMVRLSRALSRIEQLEHPLASLLRDAWFRWVPAPVLNRQNQSALSFSAGTT